jgi:hypothetical protein
MGSVFSSYYYISSDCDGMLYDALSRFDQCGYFKISKYDDIIYSKSDIRNWYIHDEYDNLSILNRRYPFINISWEIILKDRYGIGYYCIDAGWFSSLNSLVGICIDKERKADEYLYEFKSISDSKIYRICKLAIMDNIHICPPICLRYGRSISGDNVIFQNTSGDIPEDIELVTSTELYEMEQNAHELIRGIVIFILNKVINHEYDNPKIYEGISISPTKSAN